MQKKIQKRGFYEGQEVMRHTHECNEKPRPTEDVKPRLPVLRLETGTAV